MCQAFKNVKVAVGICSAALILSGCFDSTGNGIVGTSTTPSPNPPSNPSSTNSAPSIAGSPGTVALVGTNWTFTPSAADADGDVLTFMIANLPSWASFDSATGQLSGAPQLGDAAVYDNIVISVSDGEATTSLAPFAINVAQTATGSATLSWTAPTLNSDGSPLTDLAAYKIYYGLAEGSYPNQINVDNPGLTTFVVDNLPPSTYFFVTTSLNSSGVESEFSNVASTVVN